MVHDWLTDDMAKYLRLNCRKSCYQLKEELEDVFGFSVSHNEVSQVIRGYRQDLKEMNDAKIEDIRRRQIEVLENSIISELVEAQKTLSKYRSKVNEAFDKLEGGQLNRNDYYTFARLEEVYNKCVIDTQKLLFDTQNKKSEIDLNVAENEKKSLVDLISNAD